MAIAREWQPHHPEREAGDAVPHVLVNSPDTGYGIFIENMLDATG